VTAPRRSALAVAILVGLVLTVGGGITLAVSQNAQIALAADRAEIPDPLNFEARDSHYRVVLLADPLRLHKPFVNNPEAQFLCTVDHADDTTTTFDTGTLSSRLETDLGTELGAFDTVAGTTSVTCRWKDDRESSSYYYSVARSSPTVSIIGGAALAAGICVLGVAILAGIRARMRAITNKRPIADRTPS
jgi:hypothetical protein